MNIRKMPQLWQLWRFISSSGTDIIYSVLLSSIKRLPRIMPMFNFMCPFMLSWLSTSDSMTSPFHQCIASCLPLSGHPLTASYMLNFSSNLLYIQPLFSNSVINYSALHPFYSYKFWSKLSLSSYWTEPLFTEWCINCIAAFWGQIK